MKKLCITLLSILVLLGISLPTYAAAATQLPTDSYYLIAADGTYLGTLGSKYDTYSIYNTYGDYGSQYSNTSIWNIYGQYGGTYSQYSPFNKYTSSPPILFYKDQGVGYFTVNKYLKHTINPYTLERSK
ncbi:hypothetical protein [Paenibacillus sp. DRB1-1]|uniref:hypothetical protein n=1 Tax=Paenibacillus sp. DRB1-1 TaxID=3422309 RepID=UPI003F94A3E4